MGISTLRRHHAARAAARQASSPRAPQSIDDVRAELAAERRKNAELLAQLERATAPRIDATRDSVYAHGDVTVAFRPGTIVADDTAAEPQAQEPEKAARRRR